MNKQVILRSDYKSLEELHKKTKKLIVELQKQKIWNYIKILFLTILIAVTTFMLTDIYLDLVVLSVTFFIISFIIVFIIIFYLIRIYTFPYKLNRSFLKFSLRFTGKDYVYYNLHDDYLEYIGDINKKFLWSDFKNLKEIKDSFMLDTGIKSNNLWIPKSILVNNDDYEFFINFAKMKILKAK